MEVKDSFCEIIFYLNIQHGCQNPTWLPKWLLKSKISIPSLSLLNLYKYVLSVYMFCLISEYIDVLRVRCSTYHIRSSKYRVCFYYGYIFIIFLNNAYKPRRDAGVILWLILHLVSVNVCKFYESIILSVTVTSNILLGW